MDEANGVLAFVQQADALQQQLDAAAVAESAAAAELARLDDDVQAATDEVTAAKAGLAKRLAEAAKFAAKVVDYKALAAHRNASISRGDTPAAVCRAACAARLQELDSALASAVATFLSKCEAFRSEWASQTVANTIEARLAELTRLVADAVARHAEADDLKSASIQAANEATQCAAVQHQTELECAGARAVAPRPLTSICFSSFSLCARLHSAYRTPSRRDGDARHAGD